MFQLQNGQSGVSFKSQVHFKQYIRKRVPFFVLGDIVRLPVEVVIGAETVIIVQLCYGNDRRLKR